ncbi:MAG: calcium/sodium antiporter [Planctomycetota bacterium]
MIRIALDILSVVLGAGLMLFQQRVAADFGVPEWAISAVILTAGIWLLLRGGDVLVEGAVTIAKRLGVAPLIIGLTVVAFGTSAPELAFNTIAASKGNDALSFGNVVGSNIANIGLILGIGALIAPLAVHRQVIKREMPIMLMATVLFTALILLPWSSDRAVESGLSRGDAGVLLAAFLAFFGATIYFARKDKKVEAYIEEEAETFSEVRDLPLRPMWQGVVLFVIGLVMLVGGGQLGETGASGVARALGLSDALIGLTIVAIATSLPELATTLAAIKRNEVDIAVGNVVGSNIFNLLLIFGCTALVNPVGLPAEGGLLTLGVMVALSFLLYPMSRTGGRTLSRIEGCLLLLGYAAYIAYAVFDELRNGGAA